jgi:hypothetical protein
MDYFGWPGNFHGITASSARGLIRGIIDRGVASTQARGPATSSRDVGSFLRRAGHCRLVHVHAGPNHARGDVRQLNSGP